MTNTKDAILVVGVSENRYCFTLFLQMYKLIVGAY